MASFRIIWEGRRREWNLVPVLMKYISQRGTPMKLWRDFWGHFTSSHSNDKRAVWSRCVDGYIRPRMFGESFVVESRRVRSAMCGGSITVRTRTIAESGCIYLNLTTKERKQCLDVGVPTHARTHTQQTRRSVCMLHTGLFDRRRSQINNCWSCSNLQGKATW
jgi:hypothetical protein